MGLGDPLGKSEEVSVVDMVSLVSLERLYMDGLGQRQIYVLHIVSGSDYSAVRWDDRVTKSVLKNKLCRNSSLALEVGWLLLETVS